MEIKIPAVGESVFEALVAKWLKEDGERVEKDEPVCEIETDKITLEINAEVNGILSIRAKEGETVKIGAVIGAIDEQPLAKAAPLPRVEAAVRPEPPPVVQPSSPPLSPAVRKMTREQGLRPETVEGSAQNFEPHRITYYLQELAGHFHTFYNKNRVVTEDRELTIARLFLLHCVRQTLRNALAILGISAPEKM